MTINDVGKMLDRRAAQDWNRGDDDLLPIPVTNWTEDGPQSYVGQADHHLQDESPLELPRSLDEILASDLEKRMQRQPKPQRKSQFITNDPDDDTGLTTNIVRQQSCSVCIGLGRVSTDCLNCLGKGFLEILETEVDSDTLLLPENMFGQSLLPGRF